MKISGKRFVVLVSLLALSHLPSHSALSDEPKPDRYSKILIFSEGEDATSNFDYIYQFDKAGKIVGIVNIWNGGCCQASLIEEFRREGNKFIHNRSYSLEKKPADFPKAVLCDKSIVKVEIDPASSDVAGFNASSIESHHLKEAVRFAGC